MTSLQDLALDVLQTADAKAKAEASRRAAAVWRSGDVEVTAQASRLPARPARPSSPALRPPREVPRRKINRNPAGRIALLHALAHIELNAVDLAWDIVGRFQQDGQPRAFYDDWVKVADEEGKHFLMLQERLEALGGSYGDLPAHDGLWQAAETTSSDLLDRLAIVPLVLEARGLDVTPTMIEKLRAAEDQASAAVLEVIYQEEIGHVAAGKRWFDWLCTRRGLEPLPTWRARVAALFKGGLKPPFNEEARSAAGFESAYYLALDEG